MIQMFPNSLQVTAAAHLVFLAAATRTWIVTTNLCALAADWSFLYGIVLVRSGYLRNLFTLYLLLDLHMEQHTNRILSDRCCHLIEHTRAARQKDTELDENIPAPESGNDGSVLDAVRTLPENYRNAVYLHYYEGYTAAEVGRMLGAPTNTVLSWLRRARAQLHTLLKEEIEDEVV